MCLCYVRMSVDLKYFVATVRGFNLGDVSEAIVNKVVHIVENKCRTSMD